MKNRLISLVKGTLTAWPRSSLLRLLGFVPLLAVTMASGPCGKEPLGSLDGGASCTYQGTVYHSGATFRSADGCNSCSCSADGLVVCSHNVCLDGGADSGDAGGGLDGQACRDPVSGQVIPCADGGATSSRSSAIGPGFVSPA